MVGKTWDLHVREALRISHEQNFDVIHDTVAFLKKRVDEVIFDAEHFFDGFNDNPGFALKCLSAAADAGVDLICLCDTNGGRLPFEIEDTRQGRARGGELSDRNSLPQRFRGGQSPILSPQSARARCKSRVRLTGWASAAATPT